MEIFRKVICPNCGEEYTAFRPGCPKCGARRQSASRRTGAQTDTLRRGSSAGARREADTRWQTLFGLCLVAAVVIAVIVLIVTTLNGDYERYVAEPSPSESLEPTPSPSPTPTPTPTPTVESVTITYLGGPKESFTIHVGGPPVQLGAQVFPIEITEGVTWETTDASIISVDQTGKVSAVGSGTAYVVARCYGAAAECLVWVP